MVQTLAKKRNFLLKLVNLILVVVVLLAFNSWAIAANAADAEAQAKITEAERLANRGPFNVVDGVFQGSAEGYGGPVVVNVTVDNGYIEKIELVSAEKEDEAWLDMAIVLLDTIPEKQTTNVDVISDATYSSCGIINATKNALASAESYS